jgi:hypothetical protein
LLKIHKIRFACCDYFEKWLYTLKHLKSMGSDFVEDVVTEAELTLAA